VCLKIFKKKLICSKEVCFKFCVYILSNVYIYIYLCVYIFIYRYIFLYVYILVCMCIRACIIYKKRANNLEVDAFLHKKQGGTWHLYGNIAVLITQAFL